MHLRRVSEMCEKCFRKYQCIPACTESQRGYTKYAQNAHCIEMAMNYYLTIKWQNYICKNYLHSMFNTCESLAQNRQQLIPCTFILPPNKPSQPVGFFEVLAKHLLRSTQIVPDIKRITKEIYESTVSLFQSICEIEFSRNSQYLINLTSFKIIA